MMWLCRERSLDSIWKKKTFLIFGRWKNLIQLGSGGSTMDRTSWVRIPPVARHFSLLILLCLSLSVVLHIYHPHHPHLPIRHKIPPCPVGCPMLSIRTESLVVYGIKNVSFAFAQTVRHGGSVCTAFYLSMAGISNTQ